MNPPINPTHLDSNWLLPKVTNEGARSRVKTAIKKVSKFVDSPRGEEFPQTSTVFQWYELEEFEAYRHLGYLMAWAYLSNLNFSDEELQTSAACRAL